MADGYSLPYAVANHRTAELQLRDLRQSLFNQYRHPEDLLGRLRTRQEDREGNRRRAFMRRQGKLWPPIKPVTKRTLARKRLARRDPK